MKIDIQPTKQQSGQVAAAAGAELVRAAIARNGAANIVVATGASQFDMLQALVAEPNIDWGRVTGFHLDEYAQMPISHPASFRAYLKERFVDKLPGPIGAFHYVNAEGDLAAECNRLGAIISRHPIDVAFIGIGENGHLAFNDPPADFDTESPYIAVELDHACRLQQLGEGWFPTIDDVPTHAISMSIQHILNSKEIVCTVPDERKAVAVRNAVEGPVTNLAPASILQQHPAVTLYLDIPAASLLR
ncbi:MAG TPA: glucosamine-6-phosphate deaminase [Capsulimonadaceae bacterium]|jgi:glucosamine-6-phosphate deaminase